MRNSFKVLMIITILITSCTEEEIDKSDPDLVGSWILIEQLNDPGDGSGVFELVASEKIVVFSLEGTFTSNGDLCNPSIAIESPSSGTYDKDDNTLTVTNCELFGFSTNYRIENDNLIISYPCIEGCAEKYRRID